MFKIKKKVPPLLSAIHSDTQSVLVMTDNPYLMDRDVEEELRTSTPDLRFEHESKLLEGH